MGLNLVFFKSRSELGLKTLLPLSSSSSFLTARLLLSVSAAPFFRANLLQLSLTVCLLWLDHFAFVRLQLQWPGRLASPAPRVLCPFCPFICLNASYPVKMCAPAFRFAGKLIFFANFLLGSWASFWFFCEHPLECSLIEIFLLFPLFPIFQVMQYTSSAFKSDDNSYFSEFLVSK